MKTRNGFVSNSSSSSFIIQKKNLTPLQIEQIKNYQKVAFELGEYDKIELKKWQSAVCGSFGYIDDYWEIEETDEEIRGYAIMDNFDFFAFLMATGVRAGHINYERDE